MMGIGAFEGEYGQPGFTPVRRPQSTINSRVLGGEPEKEWTATRCNRLLRALTSRIALLKKDISRMQNGASAPEIIVKTTEKRKKAQDVDEDWSNGNHTKKRLKHKYSGRQGRAVIGGRTQSQTSLQEKSNSQFVAGEISVPTPFLNRARGKIIGADAVPAIQLLSDHVLDHSNNGELKTKRRNRKEDVTQHQHQYNTYMSEIKKRAVTASLPGIYEGIYNGLESLIKATTSNTPQSKLKGPRSLFTACLRAVPQYISEEEKLLEDEVVEARNRRTIDSRDISSEVYDDLESLGSSDRGWKHLKTVVRSHGVHVLTEAIATGLLDIGFCSVLVNLCFQAHATSEGEMLLSTMLSMGPFPPPQSIFFRAYHSSATIPLSLLWSAVDPGVSVSFQYQQLSSMIEDGRLPLSWLATKDFSPVWTKAIKELSSQTINAGVLQFLIVALGKLATVPGLGSEQGQILSEALNQTFSSILITVSSIVILSRNIGNSTEDTFPNPDVSEYEHIIRLLRSCLVGWENSASYNTHGSLLLLANISVKSVLDDSHSEGELVQQLLKESRKYEEVVANVLVPFICSIASCCGRGTSTKGFGHLKQLHLTLESLALTAEPNCRNLLQRLIVDSSFAFAEQVSDDESLDYATSMELKFHVIKTKQTIGETPSKSRGFRWEEGISEWVRATPAAVNKRKLLLGTRKTSPDRANPFYSSPSILNGHQADSHDIPLSIDISPQHNTSVINYSLVSPISSYLSDVDEDRQESPNSSFATTISTSSESSISAIASNLRTVRASGSSNRGSKNFSKKWEIFDDESDDELSFCDASSHEEHALQNITNMIRLKQQASKESFGKSGEGQKRTARIRKTEVVGDSEDELGM